MITVSKVYRDVLKGSSFKEYFLGICKVFAEQERESITHTINPKTSRATTTLVISDQY